MKFTLDELIGCPAKKKIRKEKMDDNEIEAKEGAIVVKEEETLAFLEGIIEVV